MNRLYKTLLASAVILSLAGCTAEGSGSTPAKEVNLRTKLEALVTTEADLGLAGKYASISEITDAKIDEKLIGTWVSADGEIICIFNEDGTSSAELVTYESYSETAYTCIEKDGRKILCEDTVMMSYDTEGNETESQIVSYTAYDVTDNALYLVSVEGEDENSQNYLCAVTALYKADEEGNNGASMKAEPVSIESYYGTWEGEKGGMVIGADGLVYDEETYTVSLDSMNRLVAEKDGESTTYSAAVQYYKEYGDNSKDIESEGYELYLYYTGEDEEDLPNLLPLMDDWKNDYGWDEWYYSGSFRSSEEKEG